MSRNIEFAKALKTRGVDWDRRFLGRRVARCRRFRSDPGYQVPLAQALKEATGLTTIASPDHRAEAGREIVPPEGRHGRAGARHALRPALGLARRADSRPGRGPRRNIGARNPRRRKRLFGTTTFGRGRRPGRQVEARNGRSEEQSRATLREIEEIPRGSIGSPLSRDRRPSHALPGQKIRPYAGAHRALAMAGAACVCSCPPHVGSSISFLTTRASAVHDDRGCAGFYLGIERQAAASCQGRTRAPAAGDRRRGVLSAVGTFVATLTASFGRFVCRRAGYRLDRPDGTGGRPALPCRSWPRDCARADLIGWADPLRRSAAAARRICRDFIGRFALDQISDHAACR